MAGLVNIDKRTEPQQRVFRGPSERLVKTLGRARCCFFQDLEPGRVTTSTASQPLRLLETMPMHVAGAKPKPTASVRRTSLLRMLETSARQFVSLPPLFTASRTRHPRHQPTTPRAIEYRILATSYSLSAIAGLPTLSPVPHPTSPFDESLLSRQAGLFEVSIDERTAIPPYASYALESLPTDIALMASTS
jgi:hypothetical protein